MTISTEQTDKAITINGLNPSTSYQITIKPTNSPGKSQQTNLTISTAASAAVPAPAPIPVPAPSPSPAAPGHGNPVGLLLGLTR